MDLSQPQVKIPLIIGACTVAACWMLVRDLESAPAAPPASQASADKQLHDYHADRINSLESKVMRLELNVNRQTNRYKAAEFDPSEETYQRIDSDVASFAVSLSNLQAYGDGSRITVKVGNPNAATFNNVKLNVKYGPRWPDSSDPKFSEKAAEVEKQVRSKEITLTKNIVAGSWNPNPIVLPGIKPEVLGFLEISIITDTVFLNQN